MGVNDGEVWLCSGCGTEVQRRDGKWYHLKNDKEECPPEEKCGPAEMVAKARARGASFLD